MLVHGEVGNGGIIYGTLDTARAFEGRTSLRFDFLDRSQNDIRRTPFRAIVRRRRRRPYLLRLLRVQCSDVRRGSLRAAAPSRWLWRVAGPFRLLERAGLRRASSQDQQFCIQGYDPPLLQGIPAIAAPAPVLRPSDQAAGHRVTMHIFKFFDPFPNAPNVEVIISQLPGAPPNFFDFPSTTTNLWVPHSSRSDEYTRGALRLR